MQIIERSMKKIGYRRIKKETEPRKIGNCNACESKATKRVTFEDKWGNLRFSLCDTCAEKEYDDLPFQSRLSFLSLTQEKPFHAGGQVDDTKTT